MTGFGFISFVVGRMHTCRCAPTLIDVRHRRRDHRARVDGVEVFGRQSYPVLHVRPGRFRLRACGARDHTESPPPSKFQT